MPTAQSQVEPLKLYRFRKSRNCWKHIANSDTDDPPAERTTSLTIITWNVDFTSNFATERMDAVLKHLAEDIFDKEAPEPCCIMFQEVHMKMLEHLLRNSWVRQYFKVTPVRNKKWPNEIYGNVTLIEKSVPVSKVQMLTFGMSTMGRGAVITDMAVGTPEGDGEALIIRGINTHLESLAEGSAFRPRQLELCARFLKDKKVAGGFIAGDMNAINSYDQQYPAEYGLKDAWRMGEDKREDFTWGLQEKGLPRFPPGRLDKVFYLPSKEYHLDIPDTIGMGVKAESGVFASDHFGLLTTLEVS